MWNVNVLRWLKQCLWHMPIIFLITVDSLNLKSSDSPSRHMFVKSNDSEILHHIMPPVVNRQHAESVSRIPTSAYEQGAGNRCHGVYSVVPYGLRIPPDLAAGNRNKLIFYQPWRLLWSNRLPAILLTNGDTNSGHVARVETSMRRRVARSLKRTILQCSIIGIEGLAKMQRWMLLSSSSRIRHKLLEQLDIYPVVI